MNFLNYILITKNHRLKKNVNYIWENNQDDKVIILFDAAQSKEFKFGSNKFLRIKYVGETGTTTLVLNISFDVKKFYVASAHDICESIISDINSGIKPLYPYKCIEYKEDSELVT